MLKEVKDIWRATSDIGIAERLMAAGEVAVHIAALTAFEAFEGNQYESDRQFTRDYHVRQVLKHHAQLEQVSETPQLGA
jgi:hypothetical protein